MLKKLIQITIIASAAWAFNAQAAVDMFLKIEGVEGESKDADHNKEIDVLAWSWGMSNSSTTHLGGSGGAGKANFQDLSFTKYVDKTTPILYQRIANGQHFTKATLTVRKAGSHPVEYIIITMDTVLVTSASNGGSGGEDRLTENITLNFASYCFRYTPQKDDGSPDAKVETCFDIAANTETPPPP